MLNDLIHLLVIAFGGLIVFGGLCGIPLSILLGYKTYHDHNEGPIAGFIFGGIALFLSLGLLIMGLVIMSMDTNTKPLDPGCYRVDKESSTTLIKSGTVYVPVTSNHNVFYRIPCPAGYER